MKISTGIKELDIIMEGGYKNPSNVLILGQTSYEKNTLAFKFIAPKENEKSIYIALDMSPKEIIKKAGEVGEDLEDVYFIDVYSKVANIPTKRKDIIIDSPSALNDISLAISDLTKDVNKKLKVVFHSVSTLSLYNDEDQIIRFLQVILSRLKNKGATTLFLVDEGMHSKKFISAIRLLADEIIKIDLDDEGKVLKIANVPIEIPIKPSPFGIVVR